MRLQEFLRDHKVTKDDDFTHTSLSNPSGSFYIPNNEYDAFIDAYIESINEGYRPSITEKHKTISPILIDLDFRQTSSERQYTSDFIINFINTLLSIVVEYVDQPSMTCYILEKAKPRESSVSGEYKDGIHIVIPDVITVPCIQYEIRKRIITDYPTSVCFDGVHNQVSDIYDEAVIERNNWFMYGSMKPTEDNGWTITRAIKAITETSNATEIPIPRDMKYLIKELSIRYNVSDESKYTTKGKLVVKNQNKPINIMPPPINETMTPEDEEEIRELLGLLKPYRVDNYQEWIRVGWCLHNIHKDALKLWDDFSKRSIKHTPGECERLWTTMRDDGLTKRSLHMWAKQDDPRGYIYLMMNKKYEDDLVTFKEARKNPKTYEYNQLKAIFEKEFCKVLDPICYVQDKDTDWIIKDESKLRKTFRNVYCKVDDKLKTFIEEWLDDAYIRTYEKMDFLPPPQECPSDVLNLWKGFAIDKVNVESSGNIEPFLKHVGVLVGNTPQGKKYLLKWLAQLIQEPGQLTGIAPIFLSEEGAGKNIFWDNFAKIIGKQYYYETADPVKDLFGRFCNGRKHKLLIDLDEANGKDTFANSEVLKNMITSETFNYEQKGVDGITLQNFARFIFTTNNMMCAKITDNSRRYVVFEVSNELIGNASYFKGFAAYMSDKTNQKAIIEYLRSINIKDTNWTTERPITETYNALKSLCADPIMKFLTWLWEKNRNEEKILKIASDIHKEFLEYLEKELKFKEDSVRIWNRTIFGRKMSSICQLKIGMEKLVNHGPCRLKGYSIDLKDLQKFLESKGLLSEAVYMFIDDAL